MTRQEFLKRERLRIAAAVLLTLSLPFWAQDHNPAGAQPVLIFGALAVMAWVPILGLLMGSDKFRKEFYED